MPSMSDVTAEELELLLREKEELVEALTERLEQAAEQLDRFQRVNGDRGRWMSGGVPAELVEQQQELCGDLERAVKQWEAADCGSALGRIETQLQELRDLVARGTADRRDEPARRRSGDRLPERTVAQDAPAASGLSAWEAMKAGLLGDEPPADDAPAASPSERPAAQDSGPDPFAGPPLEAPAAFDYDDADRAALRKAVRPLQGRTFLIDVTEEHVSRPLRDPAAELAVAERLWAAGRAGGRHPRRRAVGLEGRSARQRQVRRSGRSISGSKAKN